MSRRLNMFKWVGRILEKLIVNLLTIGGVAVVAYFFVTRYIF